MSAAPSEDPRVRLAAERTLLAWVRTALAMMGFGFVVARFGLFLREIAASGQREPPTSSGLSLGIGTGMVVLGVVVTIAAGLQHRSFLSRVKRGEPEPTVTWSLGLIVACALAAIGLAMTSYLLLASL